MAQIFLEKEQFINRLRQIEVLIFDWDGVFNDGSKSHEMHSNFSEVDSMGINLLRYCLWKIHGKQPLTFVITGQNNKTAHSFAKREHFHGIAEGVKYKYEVLDRLSKQYNFAFEQCAFFYDDVLDLSISEKVGMAVQIPHFGDVQFNSFVERHECVHLRAAHSGGQNAIREVSDYILDQLNMLDKVYEGRMHFSEDYRAYWDGRQKQETMIV